MTTISKLLIAIVIITTASVAYAQQCRNMNCTTIGNQTFCTCF